MRVRFLKHPACGCLIRMMHPEGLTSPAYVHCIDPTKLRYAEVRRIYREELKHTLRTLERNSLHL